MASLRRLSSGKWQAQVRRAGLPGRARSFAQRADAIQWARTLEREADRGIYVDCSEADRTMLAELIDRYLAEVTPLKKSAVFELRRLRFEEILWVLLRLPAASKAHRLLPG